jgi:hypothetical protein
MGVKQTKANWLRELNTNATTPLRRYTQPNARSLKEYEQILHIDTRSLKPGDIVLDSGGGFGVAAMELAREKGVKAVVVNTQDGMGQLMEMGKVHTRPTLPFAMKVKSVGKNSAEVLAGVAKALGLDASPFVDKGQRKELRSEAAERSEEIVDHLRELSESGNLTYVTEFVEDVLPKYKGQVKLLPDLWGAFGYSSERVRLIEGFYSALAEDGSAHIYVSRVSPTIVLDNPDDRNGIDLVDYLVETYPSIFSSEESHVGGNSGVVLHMKKDPDIPELSLRLSVHSVSQPETWENFTAPAVALVKNHV